MHRRLALAFALGLPGWAHSAGAQPEPTPAPHSPAPSESQSGLQASPSPTALPPAGWPAQLSLNVTGAPAAAAFVQAQVQAAVTRAIRPLLPAGALLSVGAPQPDAQDLGSGFTTSFEVPLHAAATALGVVDAVVTVQVTNLAVEPVTPQWLMLDDDPEYIHTEGVLFKGAIYSTHPARLYYYHENVETPRRVLLVLVTNATEPTRVALIDASAGPNSDVMSVGHAVSRAFIVMEPQNEGTVVDVEPSTPFIVRDFSAGPGDGIAGAVDVHVLSGGPVTAIVLAIPPGADPAAYLAGPKLPNDGHARHGTFDLSGGPGTTVAYTVGGPDASFEYGTRGRSPQNILMRDDGADAGEYGVVQNITFDIANPLAAAATVYLYEEPIGGVVRNSFSVDGTIVDVGCARLSQRYQVSSFSVDPNGSRSVHVVTMTDGSSNYPLEVGVSATPPLPTTPPIGAPDGCFPKPGYTPLATPEPEREPTAAPGLPTGVPPPPTPVPEVSAPPTSVPP